MTRRLWTVALLGQAPCSLSRQPRARALPRTPGNRYPEWWNYDQPDPATGNNVAVLECLDSGTACDPSAAAEHSLDGLFQGA